MTLELEVFPCERPKKKPEPEEAAAEYYPGAYLESGTELTVALELATPLVPEKKPRPAAELQRIVTLIRYNDTPTLLGLLSLVKAANDAIGMNSASAWESYKEDKREDLDLVTGIQIVDGETRLFIFEGQPATYEPLNAMGRLGKMLERTQPNSNLAFTLMNTSITFPTRLYNTFEMPTKLIKLRSTLPQLLVKPDIYQYLRVQEGCRDALLCLGKLLQSTTLRYAYKAEAFPAAKDLMQLEKKFGGVQLVVDREGVVEDDDDDDEEEGVAGAPSGAGGKAGRAGGKRHRHAPRKAATDCQNEAWYGSLKTREDAEPIDYMAKNIADLPKPPTPKPLPEWYLASIPRPKGPIFAYSGQRLNQTEVQKETLRNTLEKLHKQGKHMSYNRNFLWADSIGDREPPKAQARGDPESRSRSPPHSVGCARSARVQQGRHALVVPNAAAVGLSHRRTQGTMGRGGAARLAAADCARGQAAAHQGGRRHNALQATLRSQPEGLGVPRGVPRVALSLHLPADRRGHRRRARGAHRGRDRDLEEEACGGRACPSRRPAHPRPPAADGQVHVDAQGQADEALAQGAVPRQEPYDPRA